MGPHLISLAQDSAIRKLALPILLPSVLMSIGQMALVVILPLYILDRGDSLATAALIFACRNIGSMLVNLPASIAIAKFGIRPAMLAGIILIIIGTLSIVVASNNVTIALATLTFGAGMGTWLLARMAYVTQHIPSHQRGTSMATLAGIQRLGLLIGPLLGTFSVQYIGYQAVFLGVAMFAVATLILVWLFSRIGSVQEQSVQEQSVQAHDSKPKAPAPINNVFMLAPIILSRHYKIFLTAGLFVFCLQMIREQRRLLITLWGAAIGLELEAIGLVVSLSAAVDMLMFPVAAYLMDKKGRKVSGVLCIVALGTALGLLSLTSTFQTYLLVAILAGIGNGFGSGVVMTLGSDFAPAQGSSQFLGVWRMVCDLGAFSGPALTAIASSLFVALNLSALIGLLGGLVLYFFVEETLPQKPQRKLADT